MKIPLDSNTFAAARASYFRTVDGLRESHAQIYFHDESWINLGEEKQSIWILEGEGRIRRSDGRGLFIIFYRKIYSLPTLL